MAVIGIDLGGTKVAAAIFHADGKMLLKETKLLDGATGADCTTHTADTKAHAFKYFISGGRCDTGVSEVEAETAEFEVGGVRTSVGAALTHVGPYFKF